MQSYRNPAYIRPGTPGDVVNLCIGGRLFITRRATLYRLPDSRLYMIATQGEEMMRAHKNDYRSQASMETTTSGEYTVGGATLLPTPIASSLFGNMDLISAAAVCRNQVYNVGGDNSAAPVRQCVTYPIMEHTNTPQPVYFFDRDPEIFRFVLDYYRTGELHLPSNICGPFVRKELIFWGIDESLIDPCCMPAYMRYDEEKRTKKTLFRDCFEDIDSMQNLVKFSRGWKKWRYRLWLFMDHPTSSFAAKIWAMFLLVLMIASVLCYCFSTSNVFRREAWSVKSARKIPQYSVLFNLSRLADDALDVCDDSNTMTNPKIKNDCFTEPAPALVILDMTLNCILTAEFLLKVLLAPDKHKFLTSIVSIIDVFNLITYWIYITVFYFNYYFQKPSMNDAMVSPREPPANLWLLNILSMTQVLRILRIFKISKISRGLRVLILTIKKSIPELMLLGFLLMNGMFMFSCMIYMAEYNVNDTFRDIPGAFWWSIITLTTVGYGDAYPRGTAGYIIGSVAAVSGCIVTGLAIPIIGNNFNTYYMYMKNQLKEDKYLAELRKDINSTSVGNNIMKGLGGFAERTGLPMLHRKYQQFRADKQYTSGTRVTNSDQGNTHQGKKKKMQFKNFRTNKENKTSKLQDVFPTSPSMDTMKKELLQNSNDGQPKHNSMLSNSKFSIEMAGRHRPSLNPAFDVGFDRRTSMNHPLATDGVLNSLPSSSVYASGSLVRSEVDELRVETNELKLDEIRLSIRRNVSSRLLEGDQQPNPLVEYLDVPKRESDGSSYADQPNGLHVPEFSLSPTPMVEQMDNQHSPTIAKLNSVIINLSKLSPIDALKNSTGLKRNYV